VGDSAQAVSGTTSIDPIQALAWIPLDVTLETSLSNFSVRSLRDLQVGSIVRTVSPQAAEMSLQVNGQFIAWAKLEVISDHWAARITELG
jgi:flagellar motor switch/type III secretory pathway protein FliN